MTSIDFQAVASRYLLPYQQSWLADESRFKIGMWARQTGESFATACEASVDCVRRPGQHWVVLSAGERQALEWMQKARFWVGVLGKIARFSEPEYRELLNSADASESRSEIRFANGSRITAIPANPDTARGYSANLILDEFAIHERPWEIWAAIIPSVTSPHGGEKRVRIVSTPKGRGNKFAELWEQNGTWSKHKTTIEDAVRMGLKVDLAELRQAVDDEDVWAQEYLCEFCDSSSVLLPYELLSGCEGEPVDDGISPQYIGMDIGRHRDLSVLVVLTRLGDVLTATEICVLERMPFARQLEVLCAKAASHRVRRVCIDSTGIGAMLAEEAGRKLGWKAEGVTFTASSKGELYGSMRRAFEERSIRIPSERELREDLHSVQRVVSTGGGVTYSAPRTPSGHADRAAALALAVRAAKTCTPPGEIRPLRLTVSGRARARRRLRK